VQRQLETAPCIRVGESGARVACGARVDPEIDRVDGWTMESSRVDWPVKNRVDRSSRLYVFEVEPVDFQHL